MYDMLYSSLSNEEICSSFTFSTALLTLVLIMTLICLQMIAVHWTNHRMKKHRVQLSTHLLHTNKSLHEMLFCGSVGGDCDLAEKAMGMGIGMGGHSMLNRKNKRRMHTAGVLSSSFASNHHNAIDNNEREEAILQLQECVESANAVIQTVVETDDVQPLKVMNMHVEKEYIFTIMSSAFIYGVVLYSFCNDGFSVS